MVKMIISYGIFSCFVPNFGLWGHSVRGKNKGIFVCLLGLYFSGRRKEEGLLRQQYFRSIQVGKCCRSNDYFPLPLHDIIQHLGESLAPLFK